MRFWIAVRVDDDTPNVMLAWTQREPAEEYVARVNASVEEGCQRTLPVRLVEAVVEERKG